jgi:hypothetical protein
MRDNVCGYGPMCTPGTDTLAKSLDTACAKRRSEIASEGPWRWWLHRGRYDSDSDHPAAVVPGSSAGKTTRELLCKGVLAALMARRVRCPRLFLGPGALHAPAGRDRGLRARLHS